jgi:hypothetical protein
LRVTISSSNRFSTRPTKLSLSTRADLREQVDRRVASRQRVVLLVVLVLAARHGAASPEKVIPSLGRQLNVPLAAPLGRLRRTQPVERRRQRPSRASWHRCRPACRRSRTRRTPAAPQLEPLRLDRVDVLPLAHVDPGGDVGDRVLDLVVERGQRDILVSLARQSIPASNPSSFSLPSAALALVVTGNTTNGR